MIKLKKKLYLKKGDVGEIIQVQVDLRLYKGEDGDRGPQGIPGPKGYAGYMGDRGPTGDAGADVIILNQSFLLLFQILN